MKTKSEFIQILRNNESIIRSYGVKRLGIFGSVSRGEHHEGSDIDILVEFEKGSKTFDNFMKLAFFFRENI